MVHGAKRMEHDSTEKYSKEKKILKLNQRINGLKAQLSIARGNVPG